MPCLNGGTCHNKLGSYECKCLNGYDGRICEQRVGFCLQNPCAHGKCHDEANGFKCKCEEGFSGMLCDQKAEESEVNSESCLVDNRECLNEGICHKGNTSGNDSNYCECKPPFTGKWCDQHSLDEPNKEVLDHCTESLCNNGICEMKEEKPVCNCDSNYVGTFCEIKCECDPQQSCQIDPQNSSAHICFSQPGNPMVSVPLTSLNFSLTQPMAILPVIVSFYYIIKQFYVFKIMFLVFTIYFF